MQRLLLLSTFPVQVVEYFYHGQKMTYLFPRECQTKKYCLHKPFLMLSHADGFIINLSAMKHPHNWTKFFICPQTFMLLPEIMRWHLSVTSMQLVGGGEGLLCPFLKIEEKCPDFAKKKVL